MTAVTLGPRGLDFTRAIIAKALERDVGEAARFAAARWGENSAPAMLCRSAVAGGATGSGWASTLASSEGAATEFFAQVAQRTVIGRMSGLRRVPAQVRLLDQTGGFGASWTAEGAATPISAATFASTVMRPLKVTAATVVTEELLRDGSAESERLIRADLIRAMSEAIDLAFLDPDNAGVADEKPASIVNVIASSSPAGTIAPTGTVADDLEALIADFSGDLTMAYFVCKPDYAAALSGADRPNIGARGGELLGIPVLTSRSAPGGLILVDPTRIAVVDDGGAVKVSREATVEMEDAPSGDSLTPTATTAVSLWQVNAVGIAAMRAINWSARTDAVAMLEEAA